VDQVANANVLAQNYLQQNINQAVQIQTQQLQDQLAYAEVGEDIAMTSTKRLAERNWKTQRNFLNDLN